MPCSDDERREVARRMRDVEKHAIPDARISDNPMTVELIAAAVFYDLPYVRGLFSRLSDLIEPPTQCPYYHSDRHHCSAYDDVVDREALLALADEMDRVSDENRLTGMMSIGRARAWADRIRKACGETA